MPKVTIFGTRAQERMPSRNSQKRSVITNAWTKESRSTGEVDE
jgi:hypothetical protein